MDLNAVIYLTEEWLIGTWTHGPGDCVFCSPEYAARLEKSGKGIVVGYFDDYLKEWLEAEPEHQADAEYWMNWRRMLHPTVIYEVDHKLFDEQHT